MCPLYSLKWISTRWQYRMTYCVLKKKGVDVTLHGDDDESGAIVIISFVATVPIKGRDPCSVFISIVNLFLKSVRSQLKAIIYKNRPIKILCRHKHCSYRKR